MSAQNGNLITERHPHIHTSGEIAAYRKGFRDGADEAAAEILIELEEIFGDDLKATSLWQDVFGQIENLKAGN